MTYWSLEKNYLGYYWRGESCWGGSPEENGAWSTRDEALMSKPLGAGDDWFDNTGDPADAPREASWV